LNFLCLMFCCVAFGDSQYSFGCSALEEFVAELLTICT
jgi:hypothetical protein